jgi:ubiquinone/menaquinone biosynthesis C-methylase UbiE
MKETALMEENFPTESIRVCPVELAGHLDSGIRRWLQNPHKLLAPFVTPGMTTLDVGCGPGFFSIEMARLVGPGGKVFAADLQKGMLDKVAAKIEGTELAGRIQLVKCDSTSINVTGPVDFALAFYMVHEVPNKPHFFEQLHDVVVENGKVLLIEPKLFHVSRRAFCETVYYAGLEGFQGECGPKLPFSWSAILTRRPRSVSETARTS